MESIKVCVSCEIEKPVQDFPPRWSRICKKCKGLRHKVWEKQIDPITGLTNRRKSDLKARSLEKDRYRKYHRNLRQKVLTYYSNGAMNCSCCKENTEKFLSIDHVVPVHQLEDKSLPRCGFKLYRWLIQSKFPEGFRVLCHNCNMGRYLNGGVCPHEEQNFHVRVT